MGIYLGNRVFRVGDGKVPVRDVLVHQPYVQVGMFIIVFHRGMQVIPVGDRVGPCLEIRGIVDPDLALLCRSCDEIHVTRVFSINQGHITTIIHDIADDPVRSLHPLKLDVWALEGGEREVVLPVTVEHAIAAR